MIGRVGEPLLLPKIAWERPDCSLSEASYLDDPNIKEDTMNCLLGKGYEKLKVLVFRGISGNDTILTLMADFMDKSQKSRG